MLPQLKKKKLKKSLRFPFFFFPLSLSKPQSPAEPPAQGLNLGQPRPIPSPLEAALLRPWSPRFSLFQLPPSLHCSISCHTISKSKAGKKKKKNHSGCQELSSVMRGWVFSQRRGERTRPLPTHEYRFLQTHGTRVNRRNDQPGNFRP